MKDRAKNLIHSEVFPGVLLILATLVSLVLANGPLAIPYEHLLSEIKLFNHFDLHMFVNDFLMAIFFLFVGLEIKEEILYGHLSSLKKASFPVIAALGGVIVPAIIFMVFNIGTPFERGIGVPISTDIAFAIGVFMLLQNKLNPSLKIFLLSLAVVDDLISIFVIGIVYSSTIHYSFFFAALILVGLLFIMNHIFKVNKITPYLLIGLVIWFLIYASGVHATISGVLLAMTIPTHILKKEKESMSHKLEHILNPMCNLLILPLFALVNTAIRLSSNLDFNSAGTLALGTIVALSVGKPLGIMLFTFVASKLGLTEKPQGSTWTSIFSVSLLAGIGFTMAIFVAEIAFRSTPQFINIAKISILIASILSIFTTYIVATFTSKKEYSSKKNLPTQTSLLESNEAA